MTRPSQEAMIALARSSHVLTPWLRDWRQKELDQLPFAAPNNVAVAQGRCQVLTEVLRLVQGAQDIAAKSRPEG